MNIREVIDAVAVSEGPSVTLDGLVAEQIGGAARTRYTQDFRAARSSVPEGWGFLVEQLPGGKPTAEVIGPRRIASTGATVELALLGAGLRAHEYIASAAIIRAREMAAHLARQPKVVADAP